MSDETAIPSDGTTSDQKVVSTAPLPRPSIDRFDRLFTEIENLPFFLKISVVVALLIPAIAFAVLAAAVTLLFFIYPNWISTYESSPTLAVFFFLIGPVTIVAYLNFGIRSQLWHCRESRLWRKTDIWIQSSIAVCLVLVGGHLFALGYYFAEQKFPFNGALVAFIGIYCFLKSDLTSLTGANNAIYANLFSKYEPPLWEWLIMELFIAAPVCIAFSAVAYGYFKKTVCGC